MTVLHTGTQNSIARPSTAQSGSTPNCGESSESTAATLTESLIL
ncbi:MAG: hypothetical protein WB498_01245 [Candidatus Binatus sp.]